MESVKLLNILIHTSGAAFFGYALYYDHFYIHLPPHLASKPAFARLLAFPYKWKYLTVWDTVLQLVYHSVSLLNDFGGTSETSVESQSALQEVRDGLFASCAFPVGLFVSVTFWGLYAINRALVFPKEMDDFYPTWLNHAVHTGPIAFLAFELLMTPKRFPDRIASLTGNIGFSATYLSWITWVYNYNGIWAYPILETLNNYQRGAFFGAAGVSMLGFYFLGEKVCKWRWGSSEGAKGTSGSDAKNSGKGKKRKFA